MGNIIVGTIEIGVGLCILVGLFMLMRNIFLWYFGIDTLISNQREIIKLLSIIAYRSASSTQAQPSSSAPPSTPQPANQPRNRLAP